MLRLPLIIFTVFTQRQGCCNIFYFSHKCFFSLQFHSIFSFVSQPCAIEDIFKTLTVCTRTRDYFHIFVTGSSLEPYFLNALIDSPPYFHYNANPLRALRTRLLLSLLTSFHCVHCVHRVHAYYYTYLPSFFKYKMLRS